MCTNLAVPAAVEAATDAYRVKPNDTKTVYLLRQ